MSEAIAALAHAAGILPEYSDTTGTIRKTSPETQTALMAAMGLAATTESEARDNLRDLQAQQANRPVPDWIVAETDHALALPPGRGNWQLILEDGSDGGTGDLSQDAALPPLPLGIHRLQGDGWETTILSAPAKLPLPDRNWGVTLPLYGLRTEDQGGFGSYGDLQNAAVALAEVGAGFVGVNPVHAGFPTDPSAYSPYSPSHRRWLNAAYVQPAGEIAAPGSRLIDYRAAVPARMRALSAEFDSFLASGATEPFRQFSNHGDAPLHRFAVHQVLSEEFGAWWNAWPTEFQNPDSAAVHTFARTHAPRIRFHKWLQWRADAQLTEAGQAALAGGMSHGLYLDLAVGTHPYGAETWSNRDQFAAGVSLGAPPDAFSSEGQTWTLAPFNPRALIEQHFRPLAETLRKQFQFARLLRIDHILGFDRAFWVPEERGLPGAYVAMPRAALLAVARIEAARAGGLIVGEDLGNIPSGLRGDLEASGIMGCRVAMFERVSDAPCTFRAAQAYTEAALASFGTHDLPTWTGWRCGDDIKARQKIGQSSAVEADLAIRTREVEVAAFDEIAGTSSGQADALHRFVASTPARLVALQIEDIFEIKEQANLPGTVEVYPNWRRRFPLTPDQWQRDSRLANAAGLMAQNGR